MSTASPEASTTELTIVMPCLNEAETLETCIRKAQGFLERYGIAGEVIVGDNGSTDGSQAIAQRLGARVVNIPTRGYGAALYGATLAARGRYVIMGDSDDSYDFSNLMPFLEKLRAGYDLVMGNRFRGGIRPGAMPWKNRYIGNPVLTGIGRLLFRCPAGDFHCGLRGYSLTAFRRLDLRTTGMEFASEMVIKATLMGLRITEVPTTLSPDGRSRPPHLRPWRDGWRHLRFMLLYSPRWLFLYPGLLLMAIGLVVGAWLLPGPQRLAGIVFDIHTLLYAALAVLIGFQCVTFALLAKVFAINEGLLPEDSRLNHLFRYVTLETGLVLGTLLVLGGLVGSIVAVASWNEVDYGPLDASRTLRLVIPAMLCLMLGCETILASLFLSILGLRIRRM
ncbi:MAG: glycosyltransferase family 2 protein [Chloracidobacterium sp.]|uniref:Glycosyltransferase family 2 protein n=1 Tax=Chloracidobacterium validum TaxID=2821543 RepID=A0ABX8BAE0_9BACT|nr:glycosyltransferase family 2 protein [Chloracidobacterium validum]QUW03006.1 glycosyltransferase family 2 protein [Chloracidobacterium validum]